MADYRDRGIISGKTYKKLENALGRDVTIDVYHWPH
jgi:hypothetical protein